VVRMRLGCLNHALLTQRAVAAHGCRLVAWVANALEGGMPEGYGEALTDRLDAPCLGVIPAMSSIAMAADILDLHVLDT
jgi:dethiobiotin synthetase